MQVHSSVVAEPHAGAPVNVRISQGSSENRTLFRQLVSCCAYQLYVSRGCEDGHALDNWLEAEAIVWRSGARCPVGFIDMEEFIDVEASVGNFKAEDLEVLVDPFRITILGDRGKTERAEGRCRKVEAPHPVFKVLSLPPEVDPSHATAELKHGMLHIVLPKVGQEVKTYSHAHAA